MRDAQVLVPAWVATALVAIHQDRKQDAIEIMEELDRETEVSLAWYRENFLADLVRVCVASDALLARSDGSSSVRTHRAAASPVLAVGLRRDRRGLGGRPGGRGPVRTGGRGMARLRPPGGDGPGAARGRAVPRAAGVMPDRPTCMRGPRRSSPGCKPRPRSARRHPTHADRGAARATDVSGHRGPRDGLLPSLGHGRRLRHLREEAVLRHAGLPLAPPLPQAVEPQRAARPRARERDAQAPARLHELPEGRQGQTRRLGARHHPSGSASRFGVPGTRLRLTVRRPAVGGSGPPDPPELVDGPDPVPERQRPADRLRDEHLALSDGIE